jgi:hypothetical protein
MHAEGTLPLGLEALPASATCRGEGQSKEKIAMKSRHTVLRLFRLLSVLLSLSAMSLARASTTWYVVPNGAGAQTGLNWANAFPTIQQAIAAASPTADAQGHFDQVWVKEGKWVPPIIVPPPPALPYSNGYIINKSISIFGGFKGTETSVQHRLGSFLRTILEGNINNAALYTDNAFHLLNITGTTSTPGGTGAVNVVIDGFLIQNGYATGAGVNGAGILCVRASLHLANLYLRSNFAAPSPPGAPNYGGGIYFTSATAGVYPVPSFTLEIKNSEFFDDHGEQGGGIYCDGVTGSIVNTKFLENKSTGSGAAACITKMPGGDLLSFTNCVFYANLASGGGSTQAGGLYLGDINGGVGAGYARLVNCTLAENSCNSNPPPHGQALAINPYSQATIHNSIFWSNNSLGGTVFPIDGSATVTYSDVEGSWPGNGNKNVDPYFVNPAGGDLSLQLGPPPLALCIDAADYNQLPSDILDVDDDGNTFEIIPWDIARLARWVDQGSVGDTGIGTFSYLDMGAYERP